MKAEVRLGASCIWSIATLPRLTLPLAAAEVDPASTPCKPDNPPTSVEPTFSMRFTAAHAMNGMLNARYPTTASPEIAPE